MSGATPQSNDESVWRLMPWRSLLTLAAAMFLSWGIASVVAHSRHGATGVAAASVAAAVAWVSFSAALCVTAAFTGQQAVHGVLLSILLRTGLPLVAGLMISINSRPLAEAGLFGLILVHYLVALAVETPLAVRLVRRREATPSATT